ncbi:hypothetical protein [Deinococcus arenicola]|uniref:Uncharacterized protein n=1 Tax=Deinococcus arenicola TaxID=2994950 RepID=A0ABU4DTM1_9DEIO|nr:hypothetical protein [Deinococcus sp. ZS9-10]MDV6375781.1 hypothetical protein [Deinococcus sp. ZS9-10]
MEEILIPVFFLGSLFAFLLLRRQMIHRHRLELLRQQEATSPAPVTLLAHTDCAADLALQLPEPHRLYALALLCRLQDAQTETLNALSAYLNLTPAARTRLSAQGQDAVKLLREQLTLINGGVTEALGQNHTPADRMLTQGHFLGERFETAAERIRA